MEFTHETNHYELLDVSPDASPQEIRAAYVRAKATFQKDSLAIYSLMDPTEAQEMVAKIERAYHTLSHPDRKRAYDRDFLSIPNAEDQLRAGRPMAFGSTRDKVVSIDRVPPMESSFGDELLVPPATDYAPSSAAVHARDPFEPAIPQEPCERTPSAAASTTSSTNTADALTPPQKTIEASPIDFEQVSEWTGDQIRRVREARDFPMERLVEITRIRRSYLTALEMDDYAKLPAPVFVRGFLQQVARELKIPADRLVPSYLQRLEKWTQSHNSR
jgi:curved DNA-binding protein CbpA